MGEGIGTKLIQECISEAKKIEVPFVFTLTFRPSLFDKLKFKKIKVKSLPKIIFTEKTVNVNKAYGLKL
jgi:amino-acid N-acetyltransferase